MNRNIGIWQFAESLNRMVSETEFSSYVFQANVLQEFDNENGYPYTNVNVNNRTAITQKRGTNGAHPTEQGAYMVADSLYRSINNMGL